MATTTTRAGGGTVSLAHMVDLALGTPDVGNVNFNILHTLLHAMLTKLDIGNITTELAFEEGDLNILSTQSGSKTGQKTGVDGEDGENTDKKNNDNTDEKTAEKTDGKTTENPGQGGVVATGQPVYHVLQRKVAALEQQMQELNDLPSNAKIFERSKPVGDGEQPRPVADMWQSLQLKNRVDANEEGVGKLMSLVEELISEMNKLKNYSESLKTDLENLDVQALRDLLSQMSKDLEDMTTRMNNTTDLDDLRTRMTDLEALSNSLKDKLGTYPDAESFNDYVTWKGLEESLKGLRAELEPPERIVIEMQTQTSRPPSSKAPSRPPSSKGPSEELQKMLESIGLLSSNHEKVEVRVDKLEEELPNKADKSDLAGLSQGSSVEIPDDLLAQLKDLEEQRKALNLAREKDNEALARLKQIMQQLQTELDLVQTTANILTDENNNKTKQIETLLSTSDKLERMKADKAYVQSEVDEKADKRLVEDTVSRLLFDKTTDELNKMIKELLNNLSGKEDEWKRLIESMTEDVDGKLDRLEFGSIRDELERRLKALARRLKELSLMDGEDDAAGIRRQLLQRFNCISCDRPVGIMPHGPVPSIPCPQGLPAMRSSRPYTTFELDKIRQHTRSLQQNSSDVIDLYASYRACGGAHTMTHAHQRINAVYRDKKMVTTSTASENTDPISEEFDIQGTDGRIYKGHMDTRLTAKLQQNQSGVITGAQANGQSAKVIYAKAVPRPPPTAPPVDSCCVRSPRLASQRIIKPNSTTT